MRRPILRQILVPLVSLVVGGVLATSLGSAWWVARQSEIRRAEELARVVDVLTVARFPYHPEVLRRMAGLSGAEFFVLDGRGDLVAGTRPLEPSDRLRLAGLPASSGWEHATAASTVEVAGEVHLAARIPLKTAEPQSLVVVSRLTSWPRAAREFAVGSLAIGGVAALGAALAGALVARRIVEPLRELSRHAARLAQGDFCPLAEPRQDDEIRRLTRSFNAMSRQLQDYARRVRDQERLATWDRLAAGIVHDVRNSVTGARMALDWHARETAGASDEGLDIARRQLEIVEELLQRYRSPTAPLELRDERCDLGEIVDEVLALVEFRCRHAGIALAWSRPRGPVWLRGDATALRQTILNLVANAIEAAPPGGGRVALHVNRSGSRWRLTVRDNGPGPPAAIADRLFEPLVTGRPEGTGLGLAVARQLTLAQAGELTWRRLDTETEFSLDLPGADEDDPDGPTAGGR